MRLVFFGPGGEPSHFMRGVVTELRERDCDVSVYDHSSECELDEALTGADLVLACGADPIRIQRLGEHRIRQGSYRLLFYATQENKSGGAHDLSGFDGVLAASDAIRQAYVFDGWSRTCWTWHEAADTSIFRPFSRKECSGDVVWIGDWGDAHHTARLFEFLIDPASDLEFRLSMFGGGYPEPVQAVLRERGVACAGPVRNERTPEILAAFRATVHVPRRPYPATRVFEALACGIPLVSAPWDDADHLFSAGEDYLAACTGEEMREHLRAVLQDARLCADLSLHGLTTILSKHTCAHRVDELLSIYQQLAALSQIRYAVVQ